MKLRNFLDEDKNEISKLYEKQPEYIPSLNHVVSNRTIINNTGKIQGYAVIKLFAEAIMFLDHSIGNKDKAKVVRLVMDNALKVCLDQGLETLHIFVDDEKYPGYSQVLQKHYNAIPVPGTTLFIDLVKD